MCCFEAELRLRVNPALVAGPYGTKSTLSCSYYQTQMDYFADNVFKWTFTTGGVERTLVSHFPVLSKFVNIVEWTFGKIKT